MSLYASLRAARAAKSGFIKLDYLGVADAAVTFPTRSASRWKSEKAVAVAVWRLLKIV
jgi:hypothetical protein